MTESSGLPSLVALAMRSQNLSQRELARRSGLSLTTVHEAYRGKIVSMEVAVKLARGLRVPLRTIAPIWAEELAGIAVG
jgi:transcriptional regulator with XRE-family HTH domain